MSRMQTLNALSTTCGDLDPNCLRRNAALVPSARDFGVIGAGPPTYYRSTSVGVMRAVFVPPFSSVPLGATALRRRTA